MLGQGAMLFQGRHVYRCRVAFVAVEAILGVAFVERMHFAIPRHFGENRSGRDGRYAPVPFYHRFRRAGQRRHPIAINEHRLRRQG